MSKAIDLIHTHPIPSLRCEMQHFRHPSGAEHIHLASEDPHRGFSVAFRTHPDDSTGLPHILEHTALCGSDRFPVRDPFFMMLRRSLQTFMNAMTYPDRTAYPFSTQVAKDFDNLLDVYLDAAFAANLDALDFAQEGWRLEEEDGKWEIKGVVYNEMKGAMADADSLMWDAIGVHLLPDTCYRHNSGGDPAVIPDLTHDDLVAFHRRVYGAANACIATYGDMDPASIQDKVLPYLERNPGEAVPVSELQPALDTHQVIDVAVPQAEGQDVRDITTTNYCWILPDTRDLEATLEGELLSELLFGHPAAPLRLALDQSRLGRSNAGSGYGAWMRNGMFSVELKGMEPGDQDKLQTLVDDCLMGLVADGFSSEDLESALHQLELSRRSSGGDRMSLGLQLCLRANGAWSRGGDIASVMDQDAALTDFAEKARQPGYVQGILETLLVNNTHSALFRCQPDPQFHAKAEAKEAELTAAKVAACDDTAKEALRTQAQALKERQETKDDPEILPTVSRADIPASRRWSEMHVADSGVYLLPAATNGILHQMALFPLQVSDTESLDLLPTLAGCLGSLGVGDAGYQEFGRRLNAVCGGVGASLDIVNTPAADGAGSSWLSLGVRGLARRHDDFLSLLPEILAGARFDESERLLELLDESIAGLQDQILGAGHSLAATAASRGLAGRAGIGHGLSGLGRLERLKALRKSCENSLDPLVELGQRCAGILRSLADAPAVVALISDTVEETSLQRSSAELWANRTMSISDARMAAISALPASTNPGNVAYTTATPVNFCAVAGPSLALDHQDAGALAVTCKVLSQQFLHKAIREKGGAYGSFAASSCAIGAITMATYRDPRLDESYADLFASCQALADDGCDDEALDEAVLSIIAGIDNPSSPSGEARARLKAELNGHTPEAIGMLREQVLSTDTDTIRRCARDYLATLEHTGHRAVITSEERAQSSGTEWINEAI